MKELTKLQRVRRHLQEQVEMKKQQIQALDRFVELLGQHSHKKPLDSSARFLA